MSCYKRPMNKQLVFIDDSGDPGFKGASSSRLIMAAALFTNPQEATSLSKRISQFRNSLGWHDDYEFKFAKLRKDIIIALLNIAINYDFQIYSVYIEKDCFKRSQNAATREREYNWLIKELLLSMPISDAKIEIDGSFSKQYKQKATSYFRKELNIPDKRKANVKFEDSRKDNLIQLADTVAGSINRSMTNKTDAEVYISIFKNKIKVLQQIRQR